MELKSYLETLYDYNYWANKRYLAVAETLTEEQLGTLLRLTERYCVVYQTLAHPPALAVTRKLATA